MKRLVAFALAAASLAGSTAAAQTVTAAQLRSTGVVGEQSDGYLGIVGDAAPPELRRQVNSVNIRRRSAYIQLADRRRVPVTAVAATMACELLATSVLPGQYYRLADRVWRQRSANAPIQRPSYCP